MKKTLKRKRIIFIVIGIVIGLMVITALFYGLHVLLKTPLAEETVGLNISGNIDFMIYNIPGKGTIDDPYIIANREFNNYHIAIKISHTSKYFKIVNCTFSNNGIAIVMHYVASGTCQIINNTIIEGRFSPFDEKIGIYIFSSDDITIKDNLFESNFEFGIILHTSKDVIIQNNNISATTSLDFMNCTNIQLSYNQLYSSDDAVDCKYSSKLNLVSNTIEAKNSGIMIIDSEDINIRNSVISANITGILIGSATGIYIANNSITALSTDYSMTVTEGISFSPSVSNATITLNTINYFTHGICSYADKLNITKNRISSCKEYAVFISAYYRKETSTIIYNNAFIDNNFAGDSQAYDDGIGTIWYNELLSIGNYWSDLAGAIYYINGSANSVDLYPLPLPPVL
ncbi:MAG: right-handed parallel beta-helix repeat-containing protein [Candidatus Heimdallarchaeaceae archaeon]